MTDRLLELAAQAGVEIEYAHESRTVGDDATPLMIKRPRLDIAHELLAKMTGVVMVWGSVTKTWAGYTTDETDEGAVDIIGTFEECVIVLAERWVK